MNLTKEQWQDIYETRARLEAYKNTIQPYPPYPEEIEAKPIEKLIIHKVISDKTELHLREKLHNVMKELQEHRTNKDIHYSDKKRYNTYQYD